MEMVIEKLEQAVELGKRLHHFFIALNGAEGFPYINSARGIEQIAENQVGIEEWMCPVTVEGLRRHPEVTILIWNPVAEDGYEILGRVMIIEGEDYVNGYAPEVEENAYLPQVKRRLIIRAEKILEFSHALSCDVIQRLSTAGDEFRDREDFSLPFCGFAPEWAEHARFDREDEPCDDGRTGESRECLDEVGGCVVGAP
jgi:hypothetical protein